MSAKKKTVYSDVYHENQNLQKQIGCMNGIFQLFDRHHFFGGWHTSSHRQKRLILGAQHQLDHHNATKAVIDKDMKAQKQKPRMSTESPQASNSSSSCSSSTFSSLDHNKTNITKSPFYNTAKKEQPPPSLTKGLNSPQTRNIIKDSMHREARGVPIKSFTNDERKVTVMKHIDSPRPVQQPKLEKTKARVYEESSRVFNDSKDERLTFHRFSYDGRESRDALKTKHKELPRLSLDSKASSMKSSALDSRLNFLGQESGGHSRSSSIVAKLMGLDDLLDTITTDENKVTKMKSSPSPSPRVAPVSKSSTMTEESKEKQASISPRLHTTSSRLPLEPAPWKQKDSSRGFPKTPSQSKKSPANTPTSPSSSVYAEMEKRITELEFKRSGKDLRALKQILGAMQKTKEKLENQRGESAELPKQLCSSNTITKSAKVMEKVKISSSSNVPTVEKLYKRENKASRERAKDFRPRNGDMKELSRQFSSIDKKTSWRNLEQERTLRTPPRMRVENCTTNLRSESCRVKKHSSKKVRENCSSNRKNKVRSTGFQLIDDQLSKISSEVRYSSYQGDTASVKSESNTSVTSHLETEVISFGNSTNPNSREQEKYVSTFKEHMPAAELVKILTEQPSPISVLDTSFYNEDSPSPVKKISTAFQDEGRGPDEAEWPLEDLGHFTDCTQSDPGYKYNQKSKDTLHLIHEPGWLISKPGENAVNQNESVYPSLFPDHIYINKILAASGLLKQACIIPTVNQLLTAHVINPDLFHVLEEIEEADGGFTEKNDPNKLYQKNHRRIVFDMVNEILVRKIGSGGIFTLGKKRMSPQGLVRELYLEINHLCGMQYCNLDDEGDGSIRLLTADMKYQSHDWTDYNGEVPAFVLDIERLIFKDLVNEIVTGQDEGLHDWPKKHCRQLFAQ